MTQLVRSSSSPTAVATRGPAWTHDVVLWIRKPRQVTPVHDSYTCAASPQFSLVDTIVGTVELRVDVDHPNIPARIVFHWPAVLNVHDHLAPASFALVVRGFVVYVTYLGNRAFHVKSVTV